MNYNLLNLKGVHPGVFFARELEKRQIPKGRFAISLQEFPQTLGSISKGKRRMNISLALKIERALGFEEGFLMMLQLYYDIEKAKQKEHKQTPDLKKLRSVLFWDTQMQKINWEKQKKAVIKRVFERGNQSEKDEIIRFYGQYEVDAALGNNGR